MYNIIIPEKIFHLPETEVKLLLVWYAKQPLKIQIEAMKLSSDLFFQWRDKYPTEKNEVRFGTFVLALKKMRHFDHIISGKNPNHDLEKIRKVTEMKADRFLARKKAERKRKNSSKKKDKILMHSQEIKMLRDKGFSFRLIAEFLKVNRRFSIHWTYIEKLWKQIEKRE